uniref:CBS domain-containing protein n=1 Tax=Leersia perrieri TaxID=77586 RepID=A0A0D9V3B2_9ORYZ
MDLHVIRGNEALNPVIKLPLENSSSSPIHSSHRYRSVEAREQDCSICSSKFPSILNMQGITKALRLHGKHLKFTVLQHMNKGIFSWATLISRIQSESPTVIIPHIGLENITVREILNAKGEAESGAVYWCSTSHLVHEAVKHMTAHNVGALVVLKSGDEKQLAGIDKLITVSSNTNILRAMELMTDRHIRHVPVFDEKVVGMISIGDIVRTIVDQQHQEVKQLKKYIKGDYY